MWTASPYSKHREWVKINSRLLDGECIEAETQMNIIQANKNLFTGWLLFHIGSIGTNGTRQLFYITFNCAYFGLSRDGIDIMYKHGFGVSLSKYDELKETCRQDSKQASRYCIFCIYKCLYICICVCMCVFVYLGVVIICNCIIV